MTLRRKAIVLVSIAFFSLILSVCAFSGRILRASYFRLEETYARKNVERARELLLARIETIEAVTSDWAQWDDTYSFLHDRGPGYIESNLVPSTFRELRLNLIILADTTGVIRHASAYSLESRQSVPPPARIPHLLTAIDGSGKERSSVSPKSGILSLPEGNLLFSAHPVLTSDGEGPPAGIIVMGRFFDRELTVELAGIMHMPVTVTPYVKPEREPSADNRMWTIVNDDRSISGFTVLNDLSGNPALLLRVDMNRDIWAQGKKIIVHFLVILALTGILFGALTLLLLHYNVIAPLLRFSSEVEEIEKKGFFSGRISVCGNDEIAGLARKINLMLASIERTERELRQSEERLLAQYKGLPLPTGKWKRAGEDFILVDFNTAAIEMTGGKIAALVGCTASDLFRERPALMEAFTRCYFERSRITLEAYDHPFGIPDERFIRYFLNYVPPDLIMIHLDDITERKRIEQNLVSSRKRLRSLASKYSSAEERERRRIAVHLHDNIGQLLAVCQFRIESVQERAQGTELNADLEEIRGTVLQAIAETRSLTTQLCPPVLYELGLTPALEWLGEQIHVRHGLRVSIRCAGDPDKTDHDLRGFLFQSARELLFNVVKHAGADTALVEVGQSDRDITVAVQDNGKGFEPESDESNNGESGGFGLFNIRERADHIGGRLIIRSEPGAGARVEIRVPLSNPQQDLTAPR